MFYYIICVGPMICIYLFFFCCRREYKSSEFELHEVFAIDIIISTGDGKVSVIVLYFYVDSSHIWSV